ncbi:MAG: ATP-dependent Clp protease adaptor ClpS [Chlorobiaceae bacterium]|jgi:ATP-dependent Clp protease adaptor protein ClpS|nr:ATP-dependent Clp protease adaptor ClpS [Chlorobiaceae bacterium]NTV17278.1 ATP-dependent Clp protease adaptor ClpS [Chlorobiaceae bacterium]
MDSALLNRWTASLSTPVTKQAEQSSGPDLLDAFRVVLFNDEEHSFDEVIEQIIKAVRCSRQKAEKHTWEVHTRGRSIVYAGPMLLCLRVSSILEEIALKTEIQTG